MSRSSVSVILAASIGLVACDRVPEDLPEPWRAPDAAAVSSCEDTVPPPPPLLVQSPADLGECLPPSFPSEWLPIRVSVRGDGRAGDDLAFESQCGWIPVPVPSAVEACIRARLKQYRWLVIETCPGNDVVQAGFLAAVRPTIPPTRYAARSVPARWTRSGCGA
jgi:hypothetical protein